MSIANFVIKALNEQKSLKITDDMLKELQYGGAQPFLRDSQGYLIWLEKCTWDGRSGYKLYEPDKHRGDCSPIFSRSYESSVQIVKRTTGGKYIETREYSHDCPTGYTGHILALNIAECTKAQKLFDNYSIGSPEFIGGLKEMFSKYVKTEEAV